MDNPNNVPLEHPEIPPVLNAPNLQVAEAPTAPAAAAPAPALGAGGGDQNGKKSEKKSYDRNHTVSVYGTTKNSREELVVQFKVNLKNNKRFPNRSETDYRGELTYKQMQNGAVAIERLSHSLKPHPQMLIGDPFEDYAMYLLECYTDWDRDSAVGATVQKETQVFKTQDWYSEENIWYFVSGQGEIWNITEGKKLSLQEIDNLSVNFEFSGKEVLYLEDKPKALALLSELISTFHSVGEEKNRSFFPSALCFFLKSLLFTPRVKMGKQNKVLFLLTGHEIGGGKTWTSNVLQKVSMDEEEIGQCYFSSSSSLVGIFKKAHNGMAVFLDEIENQPILIQKLKSIIDARWSNSPHTTNNENLYATSAMTLCGNFSREELMAIKVRRESILQEKTMSKATLLYAGNKPIKGAGAAREKTFEIATELRNYLPYLLHLTMSALDFQMTEEERKSYLHIHPEDRYILDFVELKRWIIAVKNAMCEFGVPIPVVFKPEEIDVSSLAYFCLKGKTGVKDVVKFCLKNNCADVLILTKNHSGEFGFKVEDRDFEDAPDEIKNYLRSLKSSSLTNKEGKKCRMRFLPSLGLDKKYLGFVQRSRMSVAHEFNKAFSRNVEYCTGLQACFLSSFSSRASKRKRPLGKKSKTFGAQESTPHNPVERNPREAMGRTPHGAMESPPHEEVDISQLELGGGVSGQLEEGVSKQLEEGVSKQQEEGVSKQLEEGVSKQLGGGVSNHLGDGVSNHLGGGVSKHLGGGVSNHLGGGVSKHLGGGGNKKLGRGVRRQVGRSQSSMEGGCQYAAGSDQFGEDFIQNFPDEGETNRSKKKQKLALKNPVATSLIDESDILKEFRCTNVKCGSFDHKFTTKYHFEMHLNGVKHKGSK